MNKTFLGLISLFIFGFCNTSQAKSTNFVSKILENHYFFDSQYQPLNITGIIIPNKQNQYWCHAFSTNKFLQERVKNSQITKIEERTFLVDKIDIRKILLANGMAVLDKKNLTEVEEKTLSKFQTEPIKSNLGLWKSKCNDNVNIIFEAPKDTFIKTVGTVEKVINGNSFKFKKGPIIQILQTKIPSFTDTSLAAQCFRKESKKFLEHQILGKTIQIQQKNKTGTNPRFRVFRAVKILNPKPFESDDLATILIKNGYAKHKPEKIFPNKELADLQIASYKKPNGAWSTCSPYVFGEPTPAPKPETKTETSTIDTKCIIKGNISGTKKKPIKTYHTSASGWYKRLKAEKCFESEAEAQKAGFRKVK